MVFPYVVAGDEKVSVENSLISEFAETCQHNFGVGSIATVGSCSVDGDNFDKVNDVRSVRVSTSDDNESSCVTFL